MHEIEISERDGAVCLSISVRPKARRNSVAGVRAGALLVCVTAAPDRGEANRAVVETLAEWTGVPPSHIKIIAGLKSRKKVVRISSVRRDRLVSLIASLPEER